MKTKKRTSELIMEEATKIEDSLPRRVMPSIEPLKAGTITPKYVQNHLAFYEELASGTTADGKKFQINRSGLMVYVSFDKMKGEMPKITFDIRDLLQIALDAATERKLFKK